MTVRADFSSADGSIRGGGPPQPFAFQLRPEEYADLRWYPEAYMDLPIGSSVLRATRIEQSLIQWGRDLLRDNEVTLTAVEGVAAVRPSDQAQMRRPAGYFRSALQESFPKGFPRRRCSSSRAVEWCSARTS